MHGQLHGQLIIFAYWFPTLQVFLNCLWECILWWSHYYESTKFIRNRDFFCSSVQMIHKNCWCMGVVYKLVLLRLLFEKIIATPNSSKWVVLTRWLFSRNEVCFRLSNFPCGSLIFAMLTTEKGWLLRLYLLSIIYLKISEKVGLS